MQMKSFREAIGGFIEPSAIADDEDPIVAWVARASTERGEYELDEKANDPENPPRPNTFLARAVAEAAVEERDRGELLRQPYSSQFDSNSDAEVDLLGDRELERVKHTIGGRHGHDDDEFERLMPPTSSQLVKGKYKAQESRPKKTGATESRPTKEIVIREPPPLAQKKKSWLSGWGSKKGEKGVALVENLLDIPDAKTLDPNMVEVGVVTHLREVEVVIVVKEVEVVG
ncbi:hypothetical protein Taro_042255 [Colocasia esculenta]|uniref:Uncharacterized protein n=1 Tax=Colocasia esculenta TaxID=4460 RepID=A0A843WZ65_COLES|nr:hypothetical protein [Colocasia esculenta]